MSKFDDLFCDPQTARVAIMNNRLCETGIMAFAYRGRCYGYSNDMEVEPEDIPPLIAYLEQRGMKLVRMDTRWNEPISAEHGAEVLVFHRDGFEWNGDYERDEAGYMKLSPKCRGAIHDATH